MSEDFAKSSGLVRRMKPTTPSAATVANGASVSILGEVTAHLDIQSYKGSVTLFVADLARNGMLS